MRKSYRVVDEYVVSDNDKATVSEVIIMPNNNEFSMIDFITMTSELPQLDGEYYGGKGIAKTHDGDEHDSLFGKDLSQARARKKALVDFRMSQRELVNQLRKMLDKATNTLKCLDDDIECTNKNIEKLVNLYK